MGKDKKEKTPKKDKGEMGVGDLQVRRPLHASRQTGVAADGRLERRAGWLAKAAGIAVALRDMWHVARSERHGESSPAHPGNEMGFLRRLATS